MIATMISQTTGWTSVCTEAQIDVQRVRELGGLGTYAVRGGRPVAAMPSFGAAAGFSATSHVAGAANGAKPAPGPSVWSPST